MCFRSSTASSQLQKEPLHWITSSTRLSTIWQPGTLNWKPSIPSWKMVDKLMLSVSLVLPRTLETLDANLFGIPQSKAIRTPFLMSFLRTMVTGRPSAIAFKSSSTTISHLISSSAYLSMRMLTRMTVWKFLPSWLTKPVKLQLGSISQPQRMPCWLRASIPCKCSVTITLKELLQKLSLWSTVVEDKRVTLSPRPTTAIPTRSSVLSSLGMPSRRSISKMHLDLLAAPAAQFSELHH